MNRMIPAGCLAVLCLNGCHLPPDNTAPTRKYGAASDVAVARHAQYQLWGQEFTLQPFRSVSPAAV